MGGMSEKAADYNSRQYRPWNTGNTVSPHCKNEILISSGFVWNIIGLSRRPLNATITAVKL